MRITRLARIITVALKHGLDEFALGHERTRALRPFVNACFFWRDLSSPRAVRLRQALEDLGPIFVKFGQMLSTRRDLLPTDIADELAKLQDRVPPFPSAQVVATLTGIYRRPLDQVFKSFDVQPVASASVAQVHLAQLPDGIGAKSGALVAVKVLRPNIVEVIEHDLALMQTAAALVERLWKEGKRLKPREVVAEFEKTIRDELDLTREAANCSQLRRNFRHSPLLLVPEVHWDWTDTEVLVMERMAGIPIGRIDELPRAGIDLKRLARAGVEIFFTQVFRDGFFHADMHPGNIFVAIDPANHGKYIALDFGIMGTLSERDKSYLAQNFLAFFRRDYHRVATAHLESGWVPPDTRVDELESEIRVVCEPIFDRPLKEISLAKVLVQLFRASRRFNVEIQPQLVLLQKTLLNVEGLGRQLDPDLDLWVTAKPFLERWMQDQIGLRALERRLVAEAPYLVAALPELPRLLHQRLLMPPMASDTAIREFVAAQRVRNRWLAVVALLLAIVVALLITACGSPSPRADAVDAAVWSAWIELGPDGVAIARAITSDAACPSITIDGAAQPMNVRVGPATVPLRPTIGAPAASKAAAFPITVCERNVPAGVAKANIGMRALPLPKSDIRRIVVLGDSGCRLYGAFNVWQPCNDRAAWPFAQIAETAAELAPDLVIHVGDYHYRESPCPGADSGCANSPWGYGSDAWDADFFMPAAPLLAAAPWIVVRGNHEECARAGQGWFRFLDPAPYEAQRSCNDPANDGVANYSPSYAVPIASDLQLIVFDSAKALYTPLSENDPQFQAFRRQFEEARALAARAGVTSLFAAHHPLLGFVPQRDTPPLPGNAALLSVAVTLFGTRYFPDGVALALHGHIHDFQAINFSSGQPPTLVAGIGGDYLDVELPEPFPRTLSPAAGATVETIVHSARFGFVLLERSSSDWRMSAYARDGRVVTACMLSGRHLDCYHTPR